MTPEERKAQSIAVLKEKKIPYIDWLPVLEEDFIPRTTEEIARRAIACLMAIQVACDLSGGEDGSESRAFFQDLLEKYNAAGELTPHEKTFFEGAPEQQDVINMCWKYEAYWVLLWMLGLVETLEFPDETCDCDFAIHAVADCGSFEEFLQCCHLRSKEELLQQADLIFRYHWACVDARLHGLDAPGGMDAGVVFERHWALNWLVGKGLSNDDWDDVSTDT